jgi:hypothetical protein
VCFEKRSSIFHLSAFSFFVFCDSSVMTRAALIRSASSGSRFSSSWSRSRLMMLKSVGLSSCCCVCFVPLPRDSTRAAAEVGELGADHLHAAGAVLRDRARPLGHRGRRADDPRVALALRHAVVVHPLSAAASAVWVLPRPGANASTQPPPALRRRREDELAARLHRVEPVGHARRVARLLDLGVELAGGAELAQPVAQLRVRRLVELEQVVEPLGGQR